MSVASNLVQLEASEYNDSSSFVFKMDGYVSNSNYVAKKTTMVLFVNGMYDLSTSLKWRVVK